MTDDTADKTGRADDDEPAGQPDPDEATDRPDPDGGEPVERPRSDGADPGEGLHAGVAGETPVHDQTGGAALLGGLVTRELVVKTAIGFGVAAALLYLLGLAAWGKAWQVVLRVAGVDESYRRLVVTYFAATFANYVTPLGQAGGEPFIAYVLSSDTDASYQDSLASVVTADLLNLLPFFNFAAVGLAWLLLQASLPENAETLAQGLVIMAVGVPGIVVVGWRRRDGVEAAVLRAVAPLTRYTSRVSVEGVRRRIDEFYAALERIADEPRALGHALAFAYVGWVFFALPLYFSGLALGYEVGVLLILFIVPASTLAGLVPTPGGSGAVEGALGVLLIALAGLTDAQAGAMAIVYRVASYYFAIGVGGLAALWVVKRT